MSLSVQTRVQSILYSLVLEPSNRLVSSPQHTNWPIIGLDPIDSMSCFQYRTSAAGVDSSRYNATSSSPNSSEEIESHHGTPETKLSVFSPEEFRVQPKASPYGTGRSNLPPLFTLGNSQGKRSPKPNGSKTTTFGYQDPFFASPGVVSNTQNTEDPPKLSPTASSFTPLNLRQSSPSHNMLHNLHMHLHKGGIQNGNPSLIPFPIYPVPDSTSINANPEKHPLSAERATSETISTSSSCHLSIEVVSPKIGLFSSDSENSRSLMISQVSRKTSTKEIEDFFSVSGFPSKAQEWSLISPS